MQYFPGCRRVINFDSRTAWGAGILRITLAFWVLLWCAAAAHASAGDRLVALRATITVTNKGDSPLSPYIQRITYPAADIAQQQLQRVEYRYDEQYTTEQHSNGVDKYLEFSWKVPPHAKLERKVVFYLRLKHFDFENDKQTAAVAITDSDRYFLNPTKYVESDAPEIQRIARYVSRTYSGKEDQLKAAYLYPQLRLDYQLMDVNKGALYALHSGTGDCTEYAAVFVAVARAMGVPARLTSEFLFSKRYEFSEPNHHAAEVFMDGRWIPVDPNLALDASLGYGFGRTAVSKVVLKRDGSWVWSNRVPGVSKLYRDESIDVGINWDVKVISDEK
jgi:transglutaminase-like putative cysteine protease